MKKIASIVLLFAILLINNVAIANPPALSNGVSSLILRPQQTFNLIRRTAGLAVGVGAPLALRARDYWWALSDSYPMATRSLYTSAQGVFADTTVSVIDTTVSVIDTTTQAISRSFFSSSSGVDLVPGQVPENKIVMLEPHSQGYKMFETLDEEWRLVTETSIKSSRANQAIDLYQGGQLVTGNFPYAEAPLGRMVVPNFIAPRVLDLYAHGTENAKAIAVNLPETQMVAMGISPNTLFSAQRFSEVLQVHPVYQSMTEKVNNGLIIRLIACYAGGETPDGSPCFAEELSSLMGNAVFAPSKDLAYSYPPFDLFISSDGSVGLDDIIHVDDTMHWKLFQP